MDLNNLAQQAGKLLEENTEQVDQAVDVLAGVVKERFGHAEQVDQAAEKIKEVIPDGPAPDRAPGA